MSRLGTRSPTTLALRGIRAYAPPTLGLNEHLLVASRVGGLVLPGRAGVKAARELRAYGFDGPLLVDPALYADVTKRHDSEVASLDLDTEPDWLDLQLQLGVDMALSPTPFIANNDRDALHQAIRGGTEFCERAADAGLPGLIVLPVATNFLTRDIVNFVEAIAPQRRPVALVLADRTDPYRFRAAIPNLLALIRGTKDVVLLRSDHSAIGFRAFGASLAAIGLTSATRHLVPPGSEGGGSRGDRSPSLFVDSIAAYVRGSKLERLEDDGGALDCTCSVCEGGSLKRFGDPRLKDEARRHSVEAWSSLAARVLDAPESRRAEAWRHYCRRAQWTREHLAERTGVDIGQRNPLQGWSQGET